MSKLKGVFLDRDGVINRPCKSKKGNRPPNTPEELVLYPGVPKAIRRLNDYGFLVFVVTNQGGVGLGYMTEETLAKIHTKLQQEVAAEKGHFTEVMACTHKPRANCDCRKPKPGMLLSLAEKYNVDLNKSYMVGDRAMDIAAGKAVNATTILVTTKEKIEPQPDHVSSNLNAASKLIIELEQALDNSLNNPI